MAEMGLVENLEDELEELRGKLGQYRAAHAEIRKKRVEVKYVDDPRADCHIQGWEFALDWVLGLMEGREDD